MSLALVKCALSILSNEALSAGGDIDYAAKNLDTFSSSRSSSSMIATPKHGQPAACKTSFAHVGSNDNDGDKNNNFNNNNNGPDGGPGAGSSSAASQSLAKLNNNNSTKNKTKPKTKTQPASTNAKMATLTIRNLTVTPLELKQVERFDGLPGTPQSPPSPNSSSPNLTPSSSFAKLTAKLAGRTRARSPAPPTTSTPPPNGNGSGSTTPLKPREPHTTQPITDVTIAPFSAFTTTIPAPDLSKDEHLRLTFHEPAADGPEGQGHLYTACIPGARPPKSIVMTHIDPSPTTKEFTVIYLPTHSHLSIFSSASLPTWMSQLHPSLPLSALSIPGTHNSATHHVALPSVRCQAVPVRTQLDNGVRFLDVRVSCPSDNDTLPLVHSAFPVALSGTKYFHDLLSTIYAFLDANPSEAVLMSVKREGTGKGTDAQLSRYLASERYCGGADARRWFTEPRIPALGEARGRIVLVRRFHVDESLRDSGLGIDGSVWPDNCADGTCGSGMIRVQDYYEVGQSNEIEKKIGLAQAELQRAAQQACVLPGMPGAESCEPGSESKESSPLPLFVNFLTGSNFFNASCWPEKIAAKINPAMIEYLCTGHGAPEKGPGELTIGDAGTGIVVTDWVGNNGDWDLLRCVVGWNARLQLKA
ncbi:phosphatidylinositol-specific phospholipase C [Cercophora scortea]|uniref:Phosphatidylinositol-specific phospholipase C n=1 Tax=Cercophora scortea TaxID=314031 RepID=A0AAE0MLU7_9PEZI|nr:phosphatidylinositol-specific phospholipase C [Cercophora scortea]